MGPTGGVPVGPADRRETAMKDKIDLDKVAAALQAARLRMSRPGYCGDMAPARALDLMRADTAEVAGALADLIEYLRGTRAGARNADG